MNVLMITQKVDLDDDVLGFTHTWVNKLAERVAQLHVLALSVGRHELRDNVTLYSMGKEQGAGRLRRFVNFHRVVAPLMLGRQVDVVFVHMVPLYAILATPWVKLTRVPMVLWYTHKHVGLELWLAHALVDKVVTASPESYGVKGDKLIVVGHGIDTNLFHPTPDVQPAPRSVIAVGRLSPIKDYETLIRAARVLVYQHVQKDWRFTIVGEASAATANYYASLCALVIELGLQTCVTFASTVPNQVMPGLYQSHSISVNLCPTGGMDKVVLESLACGTPAVVCNRTFAPLLGQQAEQLMFREGDPVDLANHLERLVHLSAADRVSLSGTLRGKVVAGYSVEALMDRLAGVLEESVRGD